MVQHPASGRFERRVYKRAPVNLSAHLTIGTQEFDGTCVVLSVGGCGVMVPTGPIPPGPATINLHMPDGRDLRTATEILYHSDQGHGLLGMRFIGLDQDSLAILCQISGLGH